MEDETPEVPSTEALVVSALVFYLLMSLVALGLLSVQEVDPIVVILGSGETVGRDALLGAGTGLAVVGLTWTLRDWPPMARCSDELRGILGAPSSGVIALLSVSSAVGEELLFRGALIPLLGFWLTALLFGLLHGGTAPRFRSWATFAFLSGLLLGALGVYTQNLLAPILCHLTINYFNLHLLQATEST